MDARTPDATQIPEVPQTLEGYYILHDIHSIDWPKWRSIEPRRREGIADAAMYWLQDVAHDKGDSALYSMLTQKGDLMFVHYRPSPEALNQVELSLRQIDFFSFLRPSYSYLSVI